MNNIFGEVKGGIYGGLSVKRGGEYKGKRLGINSPDSTYQKLGLYPIIGECLLYNKETQEVGTVEYKIDKVSQTIARTYHIREIPFDTTRQRRYLRLERIFNEKTTGLKKLAIDRPFMTDTEAINNQYRIYEEMYKNAKAGYYEAQTNTEIIQANEQAKQSLAPLTLLLNSVRGVLEHKIETDAEDVEDTLEAADNVSFDKEDISPSMISDLAARFGL